MPELPEVETIVRTLRPILTGRTLGGVRIIDARVARTPRREFCSLAGARPRQIRRLGKFIRIELADGRALVVHLGMAGRLAVVAAGRLLDKHTYFAVEICGGPSSGRQQSAIRNGQLRFINARWCMGGLWVVGGGGAGGPMGRSEREMPGKKNIKLQNGKRKKSHRRNGPGLGGPLGGDPTAGLGPDPLEISADEFVGRLARGRQVKAMLLDQHVLAGVGNIYADEALFAAGIHPRAVAGRLSRMRRRALWLRLRRILRAAIAKGGSSIRDYRNADGQAGWFQLDHRVYGRTGLPCQRCARPIRHATVAGRSTHFCPHCQPT